MGSNSPSPKKPSPTKPQQRPALPFPQRKKPPPPPPIYFQDIVELKFDPRLGVESQEWAGKVGKVVSCPEDHKEYVEIEIICPGGLKGKRTFWRQECMVHSLHVPMPSAPSAPPSPPQARPRRVARKKAPLAQQGFNYPATASTGFLNPPVAQGFSFAHPPPAPTGFSFNAPAATGFSLNAPAQVAAPADFAFAPAQGFYAQASAPANHNPVFNASTSVGLSGSVGIPLSTSVGLSRSVGSSS